VSLCTCMLFPPLLWGWFHSSTSLGPPLWPGALPSVHMHLYLPSQLFLESGCWSQVAATQLAAAVVTVLDASWDLA
jgi:hypothetical protein